MQEGLATEKMGVYGGCRAPFWEAENDSVDVFACFSGVPI
jgi:hypothetical protein